MPPTATTLIRWSGLANVLGGVLTAIFWFLHPGFESLEAALEPIWTFSYLLFILLILMLMWGVTGLYLRQLATTGWLAFAGYLLAFAGNAFFLGAGVYSAFVAPVLTREAPALLGDQNVLTAGPLFPFMAVTGFTFLTGYVLLGIATLRAGVYPKWMALCLFLSAPVLGLSPLMPHLARIVGCLVFGIANVGLGWRNWKLA